MADLQYRMLVGEKKLVIPLPIYHPDGRIEMQLYDNSNDPNPWDDPENVREVWKEDDGRLTMNKGYRHGR